MKEFLKNICKNSISSSVSALYGKDKQVDDNTLDLLQEDE